MVSLLLLLILDSHVLQIPKHLKCSEYQNQAFLPLPSLPIHSLKVKKKKKHKTYSLLAIRDKVIVDVLKNYKHVQIDYSGDIPSDISTDACIFFFFQKVHKFRWNLHCWRKIETDNPTLYKRISKIYNTSRKTSKSNACSTRSSPYPQIHESIPKTSLKNCTKKNVFFCFLNFVFLVSSCLYFYSFYFSWVFGYWNWN